MVDIDDPAGRPSINVVSSVFNVTEVRSEGEQLLYFGEPIVPHTMVERQLYSEFREHGYEVRLSTVSISEKDPITGLEITSDRQVLVAEPRSIGIDGIPWKNILFGVLTIVTTLYAGTQWYGLNGGRGDPMAVLQAWPFALAVLGVLGVHELGHYAMSRYHRVDASLPYFLPVPTIFGTMGAVIKMNGRIPSRKALFDIGVAGPLAGLIAAVVVTAIGLQLDPVATGNSFPFIKELKYPPLIHWIAGLTGSQLSYDSAMRVNPVVVGGWVGMFVTFLNLIPVGQLDGGHLLRAMLGKRHETIGSLVPAGLFGLGAYLYYVQGLPLHSVFLWFFWGLIAIGLAYVGPAHPMNDEPLDPRRIAIGVLTFVLGLLCFTPVPFELV